MIRGLSPGSFSATGRGVRTGLGIEARTGGIPELRELEDVLGVVQFIKDFEQRIINRVLFVVIGVAVPDLDDLER